MVEGFEFVCQSAQCKRCFTCPYFPLSSSYFGEIRYKGSAAHDAVEHLWVLRKSTQIRPFFSLSAYTKLHLRFHRETVCHFESKERLDTFSILHQTKHHNFWIETSFASVTIHWVMVRDANGGARRALRWNTWCSLHIYEVLMFIFALCILKSTQFTHQQMHYLLTWLKVLNLH